MEMNVDTRRKFRKNAQDEPAHFTSRAQSVAGVDEQKVTCRKLFKEADAHILCLADHQLDTSISLAV